MVKDRVVISVADAHRLTYQRLEFADLERVVSELDGVTVGFGVLNFRALIEARNPAAFNAILGPHAWSLRWTEAVCSLTNPAAFLMNEGYGAWWRKAIVIQTYIVRKGLV